jgi:predicted P-loop ATPase
LKQIPLRKGRKEPRDVDWRRNSYSAEVIQDWKDEGGNIGLRLDAEDLVIDVDPKHEDAKGRSARELLDRLELEFGLDFSDDLIVETGGNIAGYHVHLTKPEDVRIKEKLKDLFGGSIEFKSVGRQVLAPGCIHPDGGEYRKIQGSKRRPCPQELLEAITRPAAQAKSGEGATVTHGQLGEALAQLDPAEFSDYDAWRDMLFACHHGTGGSPEGLEAFKAWSTSDPNHAAAGEDIEYFWEAADSEHGEGRTIKSLYYQLSKLGFGMPPGDPIKDFADLIASLPAETLPRVVFERRSNGKPVNSFANTLTAIRALNPQLRLGRNELTDNIEARVKSLPFNHEAATHIWSDGMDRILREWILRQFGMECSKESVYEAVQTIALERQFNPITEYLEALEWDGRKRIGSWLVDYAGADDTDYGRAIGRLTLLGAVARVFRPGIKFDTMLVLEGPQGGYKSSLVAVLGGDWYVDGLPNRGLNDKEIIEHTRCGWILEWGELSSIRKQGVDSLKAFLSRGVDRARLSYARHATDHPRRFVAIGTTNSSSYLIDDTGNRRFWPVKLGDVNLEAFKHDRDQLWAEAVAEWKENPRAAALVLQKELWADAAIEQDRRRIHDPWSDEVSSIAEKLHESDGRIVRATDILSDLGVMVDRQTRANTSRVRGILERRGWEYGSYHCRAEKKNVKGFREATSNK